MLNCIHATVLEETFKKNSSWSEASEEIAIQGQKVFASGEKDCEANLLLTVEIGKQKNSPFYYKIEIEGTFSWNEWDIQKGNEESVISLEGMKFLNSFVRVYLYEALKRADMVPVILPELN